MVRSRRNLSRVALLGVLVVGVGAAVWGVKDAHSYKNRVFRGVSVMGHDIGGLSRGQLDLKIDVIEENLRSTPIRVASSDGGFSAPGSAFGLTVDRPRLISEAMAARRPETAGARLSTYFNSFVTSEPIQLPIRISSFSTAKALSDFEGSKRRDPIDPILRVRNGKFQTLPGSDGEGIDADALAAAIPLKFAEGNFPITVSAERVPLPSKFTTERLAALAAAATERTSKPIEFVAGGTSGSISPAEIRSWVKPQLVNGQLVLLLDKTRAQSGLKKLTSAINREPKNARLLVTDAGTIDIVPAESGVQCCTDESIGEIERALALPSGIPVQLGVRVVEPEVSTAMITGLGIKEPVGQFTTRHPAGEIRVKNIHRIADLVQGVVIRAGDTFSLNKFIGPRTAENGFFEAHVIEDGVFKESFGGGISQFATTLFNASFFAGLDIPAYKAHSIYIKRYPYGREATLSFPQPDLKIRNNTAYGVLIWPTYTESSLTVTLFSTVNMKSDVGDQTVTDQGECKLVKTTRNRVFPDGTKKTDTFRALYLPKEGVNCDGTPTAGATTTTIKPPASTQAPAGDNSDNSDSTDQPATTKQAPVQAGAGSGNSGDSAGSGGSEPVTTKASKPKPTNTTAPEAPPSSKEPKPTTPPTAPPSDGAVTAGAPPVTGVG